MVKLYVAEAKKQITTEDISKDLYVVRNKDEETATVKYSNLIVCKVSIEKNDTDEAIKDWVRKNPTYLKATLNKLKTANEKRKATMKENQKQIDNITNKVKEELLRESIAKKLKEKADKKKNKK